MDLKKKLPQAGQFVIQSLIWAPLFISVNTDWILILCSVKNCFPSRSHWYSGSTRFLFGPWSWISKPFFSHILVGEYVSLTSLDLRSKEGFACHCHPLVSMKHYVYPVINVQLKWKIIESAGSWLSLNHMPVSICLSRVCECGLWGQGVKTGLRVTDLYQVFSHAVSKMLVNHNRGM